MRRGFRYDRGDVWMYVGKLAERAGFDFFFSADVDCIYDVYEGSYKPAVRYGAQVPTYDETILVTYVAAATEHLGVISTLTTVGSTPYTTARKFATLDNLSNGRAGWNVVAGGQRASALNVGLDGQYSHEERYGRAEEYLELCYRLWDSWDADAVVMDVERDVFADPDKVHAVNFEGTYFRSPGPLNVNRSPQGRPVIAQAGASRRGIEFAAKHAEVVFSLQPFVEGMKRYRNALRTELQEKFKRDPEGVKVYFGFQPIVGETEEIARRKAETHNTLISPEAGLVTLSGHIGYDFSVHSPDDPISVVEDLEVPGAQGIIDMYTQVSDGAVRTLGDIGRIHGQSVGAPQVVGTGKQIADWMEATMDEVGGDGFMLSPIHLPASLEEFADLVVPELQRRGLVRESYPHNGMLRDSVFAS